MKRQIRSGTSLKRITYTDAFDNGRVLHGGWREMTDEDAEDEAKQASLKDPKNIYYVAYDNIMNPSSDYYWVNGKSYTSYDAALHARKSLVTSSASIRASKQLTPQIADKIYNATWGYDAIKIALRCCSNKVDGFESYQDSFDVSYQGSGKQLRDELASVLEASGIQVTTSGNKRLSFSLTSDSESRVIISKLSEDMDFSLTPNSTGYSIYVEEIYS